MYWQIIFWDSWDLRLSAFLLALGNLLCSLLCRLFSLWQSLSSGAAWVSLDLLPFPLYTFFADDFSPSLPSIAAHSMSLWWCLIKLFPVQGMCVGWVQALLESWGWGFLGWMSPWVRVWSPSPDPEFTSLFISPESSTVPTSSYILNKWVSECRRRIQSCWIDGKNFWN